MKDSWTIGPLTKFTYDERQTLRQAIKGEVQAYQEIANERFNDSKNTSLMISQEQHGVRNDVMRRNAVLQLKQKNMHEFRRKMVDIILKERESLPDYNEKGVSTGAMARKGSAISSQNGAAAALT